MFGLEGLAAGGGEEDLVEGEGVCRGGRDGEVAVVDGVERAAEEGYPHDGFRVAGESWLRRWLYDEGVVERVLVDGHQRTRKTSPALMLSRREVG